MRIGRLSTAAAVLLLAIGTTAIDTSADSVAGNSYGDVVEPRPGASNLLQPQKGSRATPKGTLDAPVDGKDGKPHEGPWVETQADRDRKKEKGDGIASSSTAADAGGRLQDGKYIPHSNEGVMDDPGRVAPKEGTRGTEGGMTEKTKDTNQYKEKVPETPKEARPLPHSEQEKIPGYDETYETTDKKTGESLLEVRPAFYLYRFICTIADNLNAET